MISKKKSKQKNIANSIIGVNKKENQDNFLIIEEDQDCIYAIFDGVGSAKNSKLSTDIAVEFIKQNYQTYKKEECFLSLLMYECNNAILSLKILEPFTTFCIAQVPNDAKRQIIFSSLGDSRIYFITKQYIDQITKDDKSAFGRNNITKCLGMNLYKNDFTQHNLNREGSSILLCTDGFYDILEKNRLKFFETFQKPNDKSIFNELNHFIEENNFDDASYIFIR
ncbi:MAG: protein phosphatase 2C domain-containing protein [Chitinophagaceae bacterium]